MHPNPEQSRRSLQIAKGKASMLLGKYAAIMTPAEKSLCAGVPDKVSAELYLDKIIALEQLLVSRLSKPKAIAKGF